MNPAPRKVIMPKKMYVPYLIFWSISGVTWPTMKLFIQSGMLRQSRDISPKRRKYLLAEAPSAVPFARTLSGQISAMMIQAHGPWLNR